MVERVPKEVEEADREARDTLRALRDGQNRVATGLQQLTQARQ